MTTEETANKLLSQIREFADVLLIEQEEQESAQVSYLLAYVAAELGFAATNNAISVIPVVLDAVSHAANVMSERAVEEAVSVLTEDSLLDLEPHGKPNLTIVH